MHVSVLFHTINNVGQDVVLKSEVNGRILIEGKYFPNADDSVMFFLYVFAM